MSGFFRNREGKAIPFCIFFKSARSVCKYDELGREIAQIAVPAALALMADPIASLVDTAFIGHIGPVELAAVGVAIALFNQASRIAIFPLVSITTSFVAEEEAIGNISPVKEDCENKETCSNPHLENKDSCSRSHQEDKESCSSTQLENKDSCSSSHQENKESISSTHQEIKESPIPQNESSSNESRSLPVTVFDVSKPENKRKRRHMPSASSALIIGSILGLLQAIMLIGASKPLLGFMGVGPKSSMLTPAHQYLVLRSLGSPAVLLSLAMQGVFRGLKDTKTPLYATVAGDLTNIILDPIFIFVFHMGVRGAAIAHVISQYLISLILLWRLMKQIVLLPPSAKHLQFGRFLKNGFLLLMRVIAVTFCVTLAASLAAHQGSTSMAAFQVLLQVWMTTSLLADGLAVAGQAMLATAFAEKDYDKAKATASRVSQLGLILGLLLAVILGGGLQFGGKLFTKDINVLHIMSIGIPFVGATQPINSLAFVFDGINYGASDFAYTAYSMIMVAIVSIGCLFALSASHGFVGIWIALTIYMSLRALAGLWRVGTGTGPWKFLWSQGSLSPDYESQL